MAYISFQPKDYFNTKLYSGNGSTNSITGVGFQPDWTWIKTRNLDGYNHNVYDAVRGVTKLLKPSGDKAEITSATSLTAFDSDGFSFGGTGTGEINQSNGTYASWNWKANGAGSANTDGDINSTVSANTTSGFSIVNYTGTLSGSGNPTVGHGLGVAPAVIIIKSASNGENWGVQHTSLPANYLLQLNTTSAQINSASQGTLTAPTSSVFTVNYSGEWGNSGQNYIAYCFAEKQGFSKFGSFTASNPCFVYTGFKPAFVILKRYSATGNWSILDNKRANSFNPQDPLYANATDAEQTSDDYDLVSNGFVIRNASGGGGGDSGSMLYMAFAEEPLVSTNGIPATAR